MSLQRRLLLYLLLCAPLVWALALVSSVLQAQHEVNELFDTEQIRLVRQIQVIAPSLQSTEPGAPSSTPIVEGGESDLEDLAIAVWNAEGQPMLLDREGVQLPWRSDASGFINLPLGEEIWRIYYLQAPEWKGLIAVGQRLDERNELVLGLVVSQSLPWLIVLPVLLLAMAWAVRQALEPLREIAQSLHERSVDDLARLHSSDAPHELQPLLQAMNGLFERIEAGLERERRLTADAAHELRTPLAVLTAQWAVVQGAQSTEERERAAAKLSQGLVRAGRLMEQLLSLSRLEAISELPHAEPLDWTSLVEQALSETLPLAERRKVELAVDWGSDPHGSRTGLYGWRGDAVLIALLLRNLLDNAVRYAPHHSSVWLRLNAERLVVENTCERTVSAEELARWGTRFHRAEGQTESGSGLGVSIAQRIAALHQLELSYHCADHRIQARLSVP